MGISDLYLPTLAPVLSNHKIKYPILVKGKEYKDESLPALNYNGNTYVPLKAIGTLTGTQVKWNDKLSQVEIGESATNSNNDYKFMLYKTYISIDGQPYETLRLTPFYKDMNNNLSVDSNNLDFYSKGLLMTDKTNNYLQRKAFHTSLSDSYDDYTFTFPGSGASFELSTKPGDEKGFVVYKADQYARNQLLIPIDDVLKKFGIQIKFNADDNNKTIILSVSKL